MDNHPIPQNVTGFQFKLVGNMTIKQFAYVLAGVILSIVTYYFPFPPVIGSIIKLICIPLFGGIGLMLAFLPIEGRPMDTMMTNFIKALFAPNQFLYRKKGRSLQSAATTQPQQQETPKTIPVDLKEQKTLQAIQQSIVTPVQTVQTPAQQVTQPSQQASQKQQKKEEPAPLSPQPITHDQLAEKQNMTQLQRQVQELHFQRQQLEQQLQHLQNQLATQGPQQAAPVSETRTQAQTPKTVPATTATPTKKLGLPNVPDTANVIAGIVKDPRGNVLSNILVEVKDTEGNPVRAFKTNALGQFASATPLAAGNYTVELEDPKKQNQFDIIQLHATNQILLPIEIISHDAREALRKELFN